MNSRTSKRLETNYWKNNVLKNMILQYFNNIITVVLVILQYFNNIITVVLVGRYHEIPSPL